MCAFGAQFTTVLTTAVSVASTALALHGQDPSNVRVIDDTGSPVPFAQVLTPAGIWRIASDSGMVALGRESRDSIQLAARRIGYAPFRGWSSRTGSSHYIVRLPRQSIELAEVRVEARVSTPLARTGFYDRLERTRRGAFVAEFIPPEELESRNAMQLSRLLEGRRSIRVGRRNGKAVILGRGGCGMSVVVDGMYLNTVEQSIAGEAPQSITRGYVSSSNMYIDDLVGGNEVMGIEIYASTANAPAEIIPLGGRGSCGVVVIWTGPRQ